MAGTEQQQAKAQYTVEIIQCAAFIIYYRVAYSGALSHSPVSSSVKCWN